eukprot:CAMPEP_0173468796 /NCGR_PEP_ID=MMETSP1357-20121228/77028_1 /TAXON_ID=77926 /ORGANISM="Hemiselmis rufescens, Strain PCC563" /LENGTH=1323 /DNA_ID=CAMNT_0014437019 /DNA_START=863 /DNA_END=4834 /DNA_ORIENTATION=-
MGGVWLLLDRLQPWVVRGELEWAACSDPTKCSSGRWSYNGYDFNGVYSCNICGAGTYSAEGATSCTSCGAGTYSGAEGATSCTSCGAGTYSGAEGATSCTPCGAGTYSGNAASICKICNKSCSLGFVSCATNGAPGSSSDACYMLPAYIALCVLLPPSAATALWFVIRFVIRVRKRARIAAEEEAARARIAAEEEAPKPTGIKYPKSPILLELGRVAADIQLSMLRWGDPRCTFSVSRGILPPGLELNNTTGAICGTPQLRLSPEKPSEEAKGMERWEVVVKAWNTKGSCTSQPLVIHVQTHEAPSQLKLESGRVLTLSVVASIAPTFKVGLPSTSFKIAPQKVGECIELLAMDAKKVSDAANEASQVQRSVVLTSSSLEEALKGGVQHSSQTAVAHLEGCKVAALDESLQTVSINALETEIKNLQRAATMTASTPQVAEVTRTTMNALTRHLEEYKRFHTCIQMTEAACFEVRRALRSSSDHAASAKSALPRIEGASNNLQLLLLSLSKSVAAITPLADPDNVLAWQGGGTLKDLRGTAENAQRSILFKISGLRDLTVSTVASATKLLSALEGALTSASHTLDAMDSVFKLSLVDSNKPVELQRSFRALDPSLLKTVLTQAPQKTSELSECLRKLVKEQQDVAASVPGWVQQLSGMLESAPALPHGLSINRETGVVSGKPQEKVQRCNFTVTAYNDTGSDEATSWMSVCDPVPPVGLGYPLQFGYKPSGKVVVLVVGHQIQLTQSDTFQPGNPPAAISVSPALPSGVSLDASGTIQGTPSQETPRSVYNVTASNLAGSCAAQIPLEVQHHVAPTSLSYPAELSSAPEALHHIIVVGDEADFKCSTNGKHLSYSVKPSLPTGLRLCSSTGHISGRAAQVVKRKEYTVTAVNANGKKQEVIVLATSHLYDEDAVLEWTADQVQLWLERELEQDADVKMMFKGVAGGGLVALASPNAPFWSQKGGSMDRNVQKLLSVRAKELMQRAETAADRKVLSDKEKKKIQDTAGSARPVGQVGSEEMSKFDEAFSLKTGRPAEAADGLEARMGVDLGKASTLFYEMKAKGVDGIREEVASFVAAREGDKEAREAEELLNYILYEGTSEKKYQNGIRDKGRKAGTKLEHFTSHEKAAIARLNPAEVVAMRLYTTSVYKFMNGPLRDDSRMARGEACPLPVTTQFAESGIKKLRKLNAPEVQHQLSKGTLADGAVGSVSRGVTLWRGMRNVTLTEEFILNGGTELAFMSTTTDLEVAVRYSLSGKSLLFKIKAKEFMVIGADLQWLSAFPAEKEVLYPPLTYLSPTGRREQVDVSRNGKTLEYTVIEVEPTMG